MKSLIAKPNIYVCASDGTPLMPIHSDKKAKRLLRSGKARIVARVPFTIQLTYDIADPVVDDCLLGIDPGRTNIGLCCIDSHGRVLFASDIETRNKTIAKLMLERKAHRQASRRGERKVRQRHAIAADKTGMARHTEFYRMLPHYENGALRCKVFRNTEARYNNRKRPDGWLTPTANHLLQSHLSLVNKCCKLLPISGIVLEINRFDFVKMENPNVKNWQYQKGRLYGFDDIYDAVDYIQNCHCPLCKNPIEHYHHIVPRSKNGSNTLDNLAGLCQKHHHLVHIDITFQEKLESKHTGLLKKYHALSVINQIMPRLITKLSQICDLYVTTGYETKQTRETYGLTKDHAMDAWCIAVSALETTPVMPVFEHVYQIKQFRRHDRARIHSQRERTYKLDGVIVAKNRRKRTDQNNIDSLHEFYIKNKQLYGKQKAREIQRQLTVVKSTRYYNDLHRMMPGAVVEFDGKRYVVSSQHSNGNYLRFTTTDKKDHSKSKCRIMLQNTGFVFCM